MFCNYLFPNFSSCDFIQILKLIISFYSIRSSTWPKIQDKNFNILRTKRAFKVEWKAFFITFKGISLKKIKQICLEGESSTSNNLQKVSGCHFRILWELFQANDLWDCCFSNKTFKQVCNTQIVVLKKLQLWSSTI